MTRQIASPARRAFLLSGAAALAAAPSLAEGLPEDSPWRPREIDPSERARLAGLAEHLSIALSREPVLVEVLDDHVRLRIAGETLFDRRDALTDYGVRLVTVVAEEMVRQKLVRLEIVAHRPKIEAAFRSWIESRRRAKAVLAALESRGIPDHRLLATGLGAAFPVSSDLMPSSTDGRDRVDLVFRPI
jgi:flagellar motor protein MotB